MAAAPAAGAPVPMSASFDAFIFDAPILAGLDPQARRELQDEMERISVPGGAVLFSEGDPADAVYLLVSGSMGVSVIDDRGQERRLARVFPPETIGEMALISNAPRSATVLALRESILLKLTRAAFDRLVERWPPAMLYVARLLADRLRSASRAGSPAYKPFTFALIPVTAGVSARDFAGVVLPEMQRLLGTIETVDRMPADAHENWFHTQEMRKSRVVYLSPDASGPWAEACLHHADHILMLAQPGEKLLQVPAILEGRSGWRRRDLVLIQEPDRTDPAPAHLSLDRLQIDLPLHVRSGHRGDLARVARTVAGQARGLVLAGGGARGFAHLGVIRALEEAGIPIDFVGGTSIGSVIAAAYALGADHAEMKARIAAAFVTDPPLTDYTLPLVALVRGRKVDLRLIGHFGERAIEDLWLPFFCVSSNLTTGTSHVHRRGPVWSALRASIAIPGLLPPVLAPEGVLVDGAMMNNLPADVMAGFQRGPVLAVDVARDVAFRGKQGARAPLMRRLLGIPAQTPDIVSLLYRAATISSDAQSLTARAQADAILHPPLGEIELRAWHRFDEIVEIGYRHARESIEAGHLDTFRL
jgi:NTE family protein